MVGRGRRASWVGWQACLAASALLLGGCGDASSRPEGPEGTGGTTSAAPARPESAGDTAGSPLVARDAAPGPTVVFLGDSLTSGFGLAEDQAFPALIADALAAEGRPIRVVNAGVSGDTTAGGLARLDWMLRQTPRVLVVGLGGNDGLRGLDLEASEANLRQIVERAQGAGVTVVLLGMQLPPNYGPDYIERFSAIYPRLAGADEVIHVPFLLEGVGGEPDLNLPDGLHPNVEGHAVIARTVLPYVREALDRSGA